jgi:Chlorophyllase
MKIIERWQRSCAVGLGLLLLAAVAQAQTNPLQKGPDPTSAILNANAGPFAIASASVPNSVSGFGGGTVYYPTTAGSYATIAICPGFTATQSSIAWIGQRLASHGFVTLTMNTNSTFDQPPSRATQLMAALRYLTTNSNSTLRSRVDPNRLGVAGHSMGGGGTLMAARDNASLKAAVPMTPWSQTKSFDRACADDHLRRRERFGRAGLVALDPVLHQSAEHARQGVRGAEWRQSLRAEQHQYADRALCGVVGQALHGQRHALRHVPVRRAAHGVRDGVCVLRLSLDVSVLVEDQVSWGKPAGVGVAAVGVSSPPSRFAQA